MKHFFIMSLLLVTKLTEGATITKVKVVELYVQPPPPSTSVTKSTTESRSTNNSNSITNSMSTTKSKTTSESKSTDSEFEYDGSYKFNKTFAEIMKEDHNQKRSLHGAQKLTWNSTLFDFASAYAQKYDCTGKLKHLGGPYGENLAIGYSPTGAIDAWYDEGKTYQYGLESTYDHFTALVWNSSSQLGCAYKYCNEVWGSYIICSYYPPGNVVGKSSENVFPLI